MQKRVISFEIRMKLKGQTKTTVFFFLLLFPLIGASQQKARARMALEGMCNTFLNLEGIQFEQSSNERIDGELVPAAAQAKIQFKPKLKIYVQAIKSDGGKGSEVLYIEGKNDGDALVNPNKFPYINLDLDPYGSIMRSNRHHTIFEAGGQYLANVIAESLKKADVLGEFNDRFFYKGQIKYKGHACHHVEIYNQDFKYESYTVAYGEDVIEIARKLLVPEHLILEANEAIHSYTDVEEGQKILVPNFYGKRIVLYIDVNHFIPWYQRIDDDKGVFAEYMMQECYLNPEFGRLAFSSENPAYGF